MVRESEIRTNELPLRRRRRRMQGSSSSGASGHLGLRASSRLGRAAATVRSVASRSSSLGYRRSLVSPHTRASKSFIGCACCDGTSCCKAADDGNVRCTFALRSPVQPNPLGTSIADLIAIEGSTFLVRLDCLDGTPLLDLKPERCLFSPIAPPQPGDFEVGSAQRQLT